MGETREDDCPKCGSSRTVEEMGGRTCLDCGQVKWNPRRRTPVAAPPSRGTAETPENAYREFFEPKQRDPSKLDNYNDGTT